MSVTFTMSREGNVLSVSSAPPANLNWREVKTMARKKLSPLVQAMNLFGQMDERDKQTLADWVRSQTTTPRKKSNKVKKPDASDTRAPALTGLENLSGSNAA